MMMMRNDMSRQKQVGSKNQYYVAIFCHCFYDEMLCKDMNFL
jgi:hypothetical protein